MAYEDNKFGQLFPTRHGALIGAGGERVMLDSIGGSEGIKKRFQTNADGSVTMLQTRNGMPEFSTTNIFAEDNINQYLESGQLSIGAFGTSNPERFNAGTWDASLLSDIDYGRWIAFADTEGWQHNTPPVASSQTSKSLGGAEGNEAYYNKKMCIQNVPPSMFTGRTRLFVQAQYGSRFTGEWGFTASVDGQPFLVHDSGLSIDSSVNSTTVIYFDEIDNSYFVLSVSTIISIRPLILPKWAKALRAKITESDWTITEKQRAEAYVLGHATISRESFFVPGDILPNRPIAYGWKANWKGDKLDMVNVTEQHIGPLPADYKFISNHYRISIARDITKSLNESDRWSYSVDLIEGPVDWVALFGISNVWVPNYVKNDYTLRRYEGDTFTATFNFSNAPIYCFYDSSDNLVIVRYSHIKTALGLTTVHEYSGRTGGLVSGWDDVNLQWGAYGPNYTCTSITFSSYFSQSVAVDFGEHVSCAGKSKTGIDIETLTGYPPTSFIGGISGTISPGVDSPDYAIYTAAVAASSGTVICYSTGDAVHTSNGSDMTAASCALIVPMDDCESFYSSALELQVITHGDKYVGVINISQVAFQYSTGLAYTHVGPSGDYTGAVVEHPDPTVFAPVVQNLGVVKQGPVAVVTPLYSSLMSSDRYWPFSNAIHRTHTSAFGATCGIDIDSLPESADQEKTFVGGV